MNPLFLAHLLGDFIFQPYALVKFKEQSNKGIALHSAIHFVLLCLLWWPTHFILFYGYLAVALVHGIIDRTKITLQRKGVSFKKGFFADQVLHLITLYVLMIFFMSFGDSPSSTYWSSQTGTTILYTLTAAAFINAFYNIVYKQKATLSRRDLLNRTLVILASFALFTLLPLLFQ